MNTQYLKSIGLSDYQVDLVADIEEALGTEQGAVKYMELEEGVRRLNTDETFELCALLHSGFGRCFDWTAVRRRLTWNG